MANSFRNDKFRDPGMLSLAVIFLLTVITLSAFFFAIFGAMLIIFPDWVVYAQDGGAISVLAAGVSLLGILELPLRVITAIFFLIWVYRTYNNLSALKARDLSFTPGWAVGWWFIPFANLVKPFQIVREIINESDPDLDNETGFLRAASETPIEVGFWWGTYLVGGFMYRISDAFYGKGDQPASEYYAVFFLAGSILYMAAAGLAIYLVREITRRQRERFQVTSISFSNADLPPPPPTFGSTDLQDSTA